MKNYYELLGVSEKALYEEIKKAFKKKALTCHPDLFPNNPQLEELFKDLALAYQTLENENSRASYNLNLSRAREKQKKAESFRENPKSNATHKAHSAQAENKNRNKQPNVHSAQTSHTSQTSNAPHGSHASQSKAKVKGASSATQSHSAPLGYEETARSYAEFFKDIFADTFGGDRGNSLKKNSAYSLVDRSGCDLKMHLKIEKDPHQATQKQNIQYSRRTACRVCQGTGNTKLELMKQCFSCGGSGTIKLTDNNFDLRRNCLACKGTGRYHPNPCGSCEGLGVEETLTSLTLDIDFQAIKDNEIYKLKNKGDYSIKTQDHGDLFITFSKGGFSTPNEKQFNSDGDTVTSFDSGPFTGRGNENNATKSQVVTQDLFCPFTMFYVGGEMQVRTPKGPVWLKIPQGVKNGQKLRIKLIHKEQEFELYYIIQIVYPDSLPEAALQGLKNFQNLLTEKNFRKVGIFRS